MLRRTLCDLNWRASTEFDRARTLFRGRARLERKIGVKQLLFLLRTQTKYRIEMKQFWERAIVRKNVDSAAQEHGSGWMHIRNDLARQNVMLLPRAQQILAQYEPLSFRAVMELCASRIPPPPPPLTAQVPEEAYLPLTSFSTPPEIKLDGITEEELENNVLQQAHPAARRELREGIERMLKASPHGVLRDYGPKDMASWMQVWREYDVMDSASFQSSANDNNSNNYNSNTNVNNSSSNYTMHENSESSSL